MSRPNQPKGNSGKKSNGQPPIGLNPPQAPRPTWIKRHGTPLNLLFAGVGAFIAAVSTAGTILWKTSDYVATVRTEIARMNETIESMEGLIQDQAERLSSKSEKIDRLELRVKVVECTSRGAEFDFGALSCIER